MIENKSGGPGGDRIRDSGAVSYGYGDNGNQTSRGSDTFTYDHENRLTQTVLGGVTSSSTYNGDGVRMSHTVGAATTNYEWDVARRLPVVLDDGTNTYVYGLDLIASIDGAGVETFFTYDGLGSTADLTDDTGAVTDTYSYDVFGDASHDSGSSDNDWLFTGEQHDGSEDLYFLRARYYDSATGRFLSQDPLGIGNGYSYVGNNPVRFIDPLGLASEGYGFGPPAVPPDSGLIYYICSGLVSISNCGDYYIIYEYPTGLDCLPGLTNRVQLCGTNFPEQWSIGDYFQDLIGFLTDDCVIALGFATGLVVWVFWSGGAALAVIAAGGEILFVTALDACTVRF